MRDVLNPALYAQLVDYYGGEDRVEVVNEGCEMHWRLIREALPGGQVRLRRDVIDGGEEYRVCCKACRDYRPRLYYNHRWGAYDADTSTRNLWLANCYNENCYSTYSEQIELYHIIYAAIARKGSVKILPGRKNDVEEINDIDWPGPTVPLAVLRSKDPDHPALTYLESRDFDPVHLSRLYGVGYCGRSRYSLAENRIIIPIPYQRRLVGWQARYIGDDVDGHSLKSHKILKYWTSPGYKRRFVAYNMERALQHDTIVIVEGPADVWRVGPMAMGLLGKTMSPAIRTRLHHNLRKNPHKTVVIALDPKQDEKAKAKGKKHHIDVLYEQLCQPLGGRVFTVLLDADKDEDCGSLGTAELREIFREEAAKAGLPVSFKRPTQ